MGIPTTLIVAMIGFMWTSIDKRFDAVDRWFNRLEDKMDTLFLKFADVDKRVTVLEK